jgi:hypothetical protein
MKHIDSFSVFEGKAWDTASKFELPSEEEFEEIVDTLQTEIFDDYSIPYMSEEETEEIGDSDQKRWELAYSGNFQVKGININVAGRMCQINILYVSRKELQEIYKKIKDEVNPILKGRTGWQLDMSHDYCDDPTIDKDHLILKPIR